MALLAAAIGLCVLFCGDALAQGKTYTIYFQSDRGGQTAVYKVQGDSAVAVTAPGAEHPSVTADNSMLFYTRVVPTAWGKFWNIFYTLNGAEFRLSTNEIYDELEPCISRDGTFFAYSSMRNDSLSIITGPLVPQSASDLQYQVTSGPRPNEMPALANGDAWVYWTVRVGNDSYIYKQPGRGGQVKRVSEVGANWGGASERFGEWTLCCLLRHYEGKNPGIRDKQRRP